jgi:Tfp pilus assembly protein PilF
VLHDFDLAQSFYESALRLDPDDVVTLTNFGRLCRRRGAFEKAKQYLGQAVRLDPTNQKAHDLLMGLSDETPG